MIGIFAMFLVLFRNIKLSLIGVIPNFIAAFFILGIIGMLGIPLDMMTITIAAITIGIAVDNSIHYIYRFKEEFDNSKDYKETLKTCHSTVGVAILNTSITIVFGFSILVLSKFITYNLLWCIYWTCYVVGYDFCFNSSSIFNFDD